MLKDILVGEARYSCDMRAPQADGPGNIALVLNCSSNANLLPKRRKLFQHPSFDQTASAQLCGTMFFELHPQLWGRGIMSEAFREVVRFAMEEVGCMELSVSARRPLFCRYKGEPPLT